jgi:hypothetical protein
MQPKSTAPLRRASGRFRIPGKELAPSQQAALRQALTNLAQLKTVF